MPWWDSMFDEEYVEAWTAAGFFDRSVEQADAIANLLGLSVGAALLDVGCGFGRIAGPLQDRGYEVTGIDISQVQLRLAEERNPGPRYVQGDMREPPSRPYDAVVNVFSSFGYFEHRQEDLTALTAWFQALRPGGVLLMELMHRDRLAWTYGQDEAPMTQGPVRETGVTDWIAGTRSATVSYGEVSKTFHVRLYTATELVRELEAVGFAHIEVWGDLDGTTSLSPETRLVIRAIK